MDYMCLNHELVCKAVMTQTLKQESKKRLFSAPNTTKKKKEAEVLGLLNPISESSGSSLNHCSLPFLMFN